MPEQLSTIYPMVPLEVLRAAWAAGGWVGPRSFVSQLRLEIKERTAGASSYDEGDEEGINGMPLVMLLMMEATAEQIRVEREIMLILARPDDVLE
jgi:hypothetical protein